MCVQYEHATKSFDILNLAVGCLVHKLIIIWIVFVVFDTIESFKTVGRRYIDVDWNHSLLYFDTIRHSTIHALHENACK